MHISYSLLPSLARLCQDHEGLIGACLFSCAPSPGTSAASGIGGGGGGGGDDDGGSGGGGGGGGDDDS